MIKTDLPTRVMSLDDLRVLPQNPREITEENLAALRASLETFGLVEDLVYNETTGHLVGGHQRVKVLRAAGMTQVPVKVVQLTAEQEEELAVTLNNPEIQGRWSSELPDLLARIRKAAPERFKRLRLDALRKLQRPKITEPPIPELPAAPITRRGDLWRLGEHRLMCGNSTEPGHVAQLLDGARPHMVLTDPPYCSGGFHEAQRSQGSIGTKDAQEIHGDKVSTRGYIIMVRAALDNIGAGLIYVFTDWRMLPNLWDLAEGLGYRIRSKIVWDKRTPGMGEGWRAQYEEILMATKVETPFDKKVSVGNVISDIGRTGNEHHPTEKPVELMARVIHVTHFADSVADPFGGAGATVLAAEQSSRRSYTMELDPAYCDVIVERWQALTGGQAVRS